MTESVRIRLVRGCAVLLLLLATGGLMMLSHRMRIMAIETGNPELSYLYSDAEMEPVGMPQDNETDVFVKLGLYDKKYDIDVGFVEFCANDERINPDGTFLVSFKSRLDAGRYDDDIWADLTGYTFSALYDIYTGAYSGGVNVLGDLFDQHKTTVSVVGLPGEDGTLTAYDLRFDVLDGVKFYLSGGLKFALCGKDSDVAAAKAVCDIVIAEADTEDGAKALADAGADVVFTESGETHVEYEGDTVAVYGIVGEGDGNGLFVTVTLAVGIDPIVRVYPCESADGTVVLCDEKTSAALLADINERSESAKTDDGGRVRYK